MVWMHKWSRLSDAEKLRLEFKQADVLANMIHDESDYLELLTAFSEVRTIDGHGSYHHHHRGLLTHLRIPISTAVPLVLVGVDDGQRRGSLRGLLQRTC